MNPKKILICQQRQIGDVLLSTACVRLLAKKYPDAQLHFLTEKKCEPVLHNNPFIFKTWLVDPKATFFERMSLYMAIRREHFDIAVDFQQLPRLKTAVLFSGAPIRISYKPKWYNSLVYNYHSEMLNGYAAQSKSGILAPLGIQWNGEQPELHLTDSEMTWAKEYLESEGIPADAPLITIDPTHRHPARKWPAEYYAELIQRLLAVYPDLRIFLLYGPGEKFDVDTIKQMAGSPERCVVSDTMTSLREMAAVIERAVGQIGNCSSPRHFAVAVNTPTLTFHGSTKPGAWTCPNPEHTYLRNEGGACLSCNASECKLGTLECMYAIKPEAALALAQSTFALPDLPAG